MAQGGEDLVLDGDAPPSAVGSVDIVSLLRLVEALGDAGGRYSCGRSCTLYPEAVAVLCSQWLNSVAVAILLP